MSIISNMSAFLSSFLRCSSIATTISEVLSRLFFSGKFIDFVQGIGRDLFAGRFSSSFSSSANCTLIIFYFVNVCGLYSIIVAYKKCKDGGLVRINAKITSKLKDDPDIIYDEMELSNAHRCWLQFLLRV